MENNLQPRCTSQEGFTVPEQLSKDQISNIKKVLADGLTIGEFGLLFEGQDSTQLPIPLLDNQGEKIGVITSLSLENKCVTFKYTPVTALEKITINVDRESLDETTRTALHNKYQEPSQQIISHLTIDNHEGIKTEDDILEAAVSQTSL